MQNLKNKRWIILLVILLCVLTCLVNVVAFRGHIAAQAESDNSSSFAASYVMSDLNNCTVDGKTFNVSDYPYMADGSPQLLTFSEYCFTENADIRDYYGLYVYIYNPGGITFAESGNSIQLAVDYSANTPTMYDNFPLELCSKSNEVTNQDLFYKFRVVDNDNRIYDRVVKTPNARRYDITGVQLLEAGARGAVDYKIAGTYTYSGYAAGCAETFNSDSTLTCSVTDFLTTLSLNVKQTFWHSSTSSQGKYHQNQLNSVYFSIPNEMANTLGTIKSIHCSFYEYQTKMMLTTSNLTLYNGLMPKVGYTLKSQQGKLYYDTSVPYSIGIGNTKITGSSNSYGEFSYGYNFCPDQAGGFHNSAGTSLQSLNYLFYDDKALDSDFVLSRTRINDWIYNYSNRYTVSSFLDIKDGQTIASDLFTDSVDSGRTRGYNNLVIDDTHTFDLLGYAQNHGFWDKVDDYGFWNSLFGNTPKDDSLVGVAPFYNVTESDLKSSDGTLSGLLFVDQSDIAEFREYCTNATRKNETTYLFRFAVTDRFAALGTHSTKNTVSLLGNSNSLYGSYETVFFDFDVIDIGFYNKEGKSVVVPVVSSPIDVVGASPTPKDPTTVAESFWDAIVSFFKMIGNFFVDAFGGQWWWWIVLIVVIILMIAFFPVLFPAILSLLQLIGKGLLSLLKLLAKGLWWLITAPVRLIKAIIHRGDGS